GDTAIPATSGVDFTVDVDPVAGGGNTAKKSLTLAGLTIVAHTTPDVFFSPLTDSPSAPALPPRALLLPHAWGALVLWIYHVNDWDVAFLYRQGPFPSLSFGDPNNNNKIDDVTEENDLKDLLARCRDLIVADPANGGVPARIFLYGWVNGNPMVCSGADPN